MSNEQQNLFETDPAPWELDAEDDRLVAEVVFPEAPRGTFDYAIPDNLVDSLQAGARVLVPLGRQRRMTGYCIGIKTGSTWGKQLRPIVSVLDVPPLMTPDILQLARWISDYYVCELGAALEAVVPAGVRGAAGTRLTKFFQVESHVVDQLSDLKLPKKQLAVVQTLATSDHPLSKEEICQAADCTYAPLQTLVKKGMVRSISKRVFTRQFALQTVAASTPWELNDDQRMARNTISAALQQSSHQTILLHGVTGSGKTEVYMQAIQEVVGYGRQAIVLVPEISLTPQTRHRFQSRFESVAVLHSHLSDSDRHAEWRRAAAGEVQVVVGARSAVFAPVPHLGLIIIDESHEPSFKQDQVPRYHARDVAKQRAELARVPLVLGSATPSLESWQAAQDGKYQLVQLPKRILDLPLPHVTTIDLRNEMRERSGYRGGISRQLNQAIAATLADGGQVILLLNRRGFSTHIQCPACGEVVNCPECAIALTHHRSVERAVCHYCDYQIHTPQVCPSCHFEGIRFGGLGTQKLEAELRARFENVSILRMDTDTMQARGSHEAALERFRNGEVRILLGTQMIAKGLDFPNVTLVGVINADIGLHLPDFRASERTFQLVTQVAGRTGRGELGGRVLVQTFTPDDVAIKAAVRHDFAAFANVELPDRREFHYPPFSSIARLIFRGESESATESFADRVESVISQHLRQHNISARILGPTVAPITKLRGKYRFHMIIQSPDRPGVSAAIRQAYAMVKPVPGVMWIVDIDAVSML